jgi:hypothetical protein
MLDEYYEANGWSKTTSVPTAGKLAELEMSDVTVALQKAGVEVEP